MATTGELRAIIADLELVEIGDAASYLGEEEDSSVFISSEPLTEKHTDTCDCISCLLLRS